MPSKQRGHIHSSLSILVILTAFNKNQTTKNREVQMLVVKYIDKTIETNILYIYCRWTNDT